MSTTQTGIIVKADEAVRQIRELLEHGYTADSFVREMMQNADDAQARRLVLAFEPDGLGGKATNPLLSGPLILIANDGRAPVGDIEALHRASGGNKETDASKVGRFGLGLKSIFHWCETFLYCGLADGDVQSGVVDPYVRQDGKDPVNPAWQVLSEGDQGELLNALRRCLGGGEAQSDGLLLVAPLRLSEHLNRGDMRLAGFQWMRGRTERPELFETELATGMGGTPRHLLAEHVLVLAQCAHLETVQANWTGGSYEVAVRQQPESGDRPSRMGRYRDPPGITPPRFERDFGCVIGVREPSACEWDVEVIGAEARAPVALELRQSPDWPMNMEEVEGQPGVYQKRPRKAVGHGAVTLLRWRSHLASRVVARWAAFLPLDVHYNPHGESPVAKNVQSLGACDVVFHGYVFVTPDRKAVYGWTTGGDENRTDSAWNQAVLKETCLPLLPKVLARAFATANDRTCGHLKAVWDAAKQLHVERSHVTARDVLLPELGDENRYVRVPAAELSRTRVVHGWPTWQSYRELRRAIQAGADDLGLRVAPHELLVPPFDSGFGPWSPVELAAILEGLPEVKGPDAKAVVSTISFVTATFRPYASPHEQETGSKAARAWALKTQASGFGPSGRLWTETTRETERKLIKWVVEFGVRMLPVSRGARPAVERLANDSPPLLLVPSGDRLDKPSDETRRACVNLVQRVVERMMAAQTEPASSDVGPKSWRLLARDLIGVIGLKAVMESAELRHLPLIPGWSPGGQPEFLLTAAELQRRAQTRLVFYFEMEDGEDEAAAPRGRAAEVRKAREWIKALADAFPDAESPCIVDLLDGIEGIACVSPETVAQAAVAQAEHVATDPTARHALLARFADAHQLESSDLRKALRLLVHGNAAKVDDVTTTLRVEPRDATLRLAIQAVMRQRGELWTVVASDGLKKFTGEQWQTLSIAEPTDRDLIDMLVARKHELNAESLPDEERLAILSIATLDKALFDGLPLHAAQPSSTHGRTFVPLQPGRTFRAGLPVPTDIDAGVFIIEPVPEERVQRLYNEVLSEFGAAALVAVALRQDASHRLSSLVLGALRQPTGSAVPLPREFSDLREQLLSCPWIPAGHERENLPGVAPRNVIDDLACDPSLQGAVRALVTSLRTPEIALASTITGSNADDLRVLCDHLNDGRNIAQRLQAVLHDRQVPSAWVTAPTGADFASDIWHSLLEADALGKARRGWSLVQEATRIGIDETDSIGLAKALTGDLNESDWVETLNALVPRENADDATDLTDAWFALAGHLKPDVARNLLTRLNVLAANNRWRPARELTAAKLNVPPSYQPHSKTREWLGVDEFDGPAAGDGPHPTGGPRLMDAQDVIKHLERYRGPVQWPVLAAVFSLCGTTDGELNAAFQGWLGHQKIEDLRHELEISVGLPIFRTQRTVRFFLSDTKPREIRATSLVGAQLSIKLSGDVTQLVERVGKEQWALDIVLRRYSLANLGALDRMAVLKETGSTFARAILGPHFVSARFDGWWSKVVSGAQASIEPARQLLLEELPVKLAEFRLGESTRLGGVEQCLRDLTRSKLGSASANDSEQRVKHDQEIRKARKRLTELLRDPRVAGALRDRVRAMLEDYAYSRASVLLELLQNADDALEQRREMLRLERLPDEARTVNIEIMAVPGAASPTVRVSHWGRLINDHGGSDFPLGKELRWDQDLYLMARFQVSAKRDNEHATSSVQSTGRFGLGFKSVHFVSDDPVVRSGSLAFRFDAALIPAEVTGEALSPVQEVEGHPATTIELPLCTQHEHEHEPLLDEMFERLAPVRAVFTAMARQVSAISLPPQYGGRVVFDPIDLPGAQGWNVTRTPAPIGRCSVARRLLRYRSTTRANSTRTLLLALDDNGVPVAMPPEVPTFWVVAPTEECWELGYCINGEFKLDTGRVRVDFKADKSTKTLDALGDELGRALVELADAVAKSDVRDLIGLRRGNESFISGLWNVLARGLGGGQPEQAKLLVQTRLHGRDCGLGRLISERAAVPSGLGAPWPAMVGPITDECSIYSASDAAADERVAPLLSAIPELMACAGPVVKHNVSVIVGRLLKVRQVDFELVPQLRAWTDRSHHHISFNDLDRLAALAESECWQTLESEGGPRPSGKLSALAEWARELRLPGRDGGMARISELLLPPAANDLSSELSTRRSSFEDELMRSAFAPDDRVAGSGLVERPTRLDVFLRLRGELSADASTLAGWARTASTSPRRMAASKYLARGSLRPQLAQEVRRLGGLPWANTRENWQQAAKAAELSKEESQSVEIALFGALPDRSGTEQEESKAAAQERPPLSEEAAKRWLDALWKTWADPDYRMKRLAELRDELWPREWTPETPARIGAWLKGDLSHPDTKRAWLVLFLLAHVQGLGLKAAQHRGFVELLLKRHSSRHRHETWFDRLFGDAAPDGTWTDFLDEWSRDRMPRYRPYGFWMRVLPDMYAATKWWRTYAESLRWERATPGSHAVLAPATDPDLAGDPDSADVPAMAGAMNRLQWIQSELRYFGVIGSTDLTAMPLVGGYEPSETLTQVLRRLGFFSNRVGESYASKDVLEWLGTMIGPHRADFHGLGKTPLELDADDLIG
ncbi:hypothetical protein L6V77_16905 [Myxococcota bacterium]|nr:hypothetical protein [Myxococcota bacterium]